LRSASSNSLRRTIARNGRSAACVTRRRPRSVNVTRSVRSAAGISIRSPTVAIVGPISPPPQVL
jgi:hypothetical protein